MNTPILRQKQWRFLAPTVAIVALLAMLAACTPPPSPAVVSVSIESDDFALEVGATKQLETNVTVKDGASKAVTWTSSEEAIATVSVAGLVTGVGVGTANITATSKADGTKKATVAVAVTEAASEAPVATLTADPPSISLGDSSTLSWAITGEFTSVSLEAVVGGVASDISIVEGATGTEVVTPVVTTEYRLNVVYEGGGPLVETAAVEVLPVGVTAPAATFTATPASISVGDSSTLSWVITGEFTTVSLEAVVGGVSTDIPIAQGASVSRVVTPAVTTLYRLTVAYEGGGPLVEMATVEVLPVGVTAPVATLAANPSSITLGGSSTLSWAITGEYTSVSLAAVVGGASTDIPIAQDATVSRVVTPVVTTLYRLTVLYEGGGPLVVTAQVEVLPVVVTPPVATFTAAPTSISVGGSSALSWEITGEYTSVSLAAVVGGASTDIPIAQDASVSRVVTPVVTTEYRLSVEYEGGGPLVETAQVEVLPVVVTAPVATFTAAPASISLGGSSTLSWAITGDFTSVSLAAVVGGVPSDIPIAQDASVSRVVTPVVTTLYRLTVLYEGGGPLVETAQVSVVVAGDLPSITSFTGEVVSGSRLTLTWTASGADGFAIYGVGEDDAEELLLGSILGSVNTATIAIPPSNRQLLRIVATNAAGEDSRETGPLANVVTNTADYDPYYAQGWIPEAEVLGTLRSVVLRAPEGAVIGFASDITTLELSGVDFTPSVADAHLFLRKGVTISGPTGRVTLKGVSGKRADQPGDAYTYRSRVVYVSSGITVTLENLVITGGEFIFVGAGVRNDGNLRIENSVITENRSWEFGGGVFNNGELTISNSRISNNEAFTTDAELGHQYEIRGGFLVPDPAFGPDGYGGGVYNRAGGVITINASTITGNSVRISGGGLFNSGTVTMTASGISGNRANRNAFAPYSGAFSYGGGVLNSGVFTFSNADIVDNDAVDQGGGLYQTSGGTGTLTTVDFDQNAAEYGGAIRLLYCGEPANNNLTMTGVDLTGNTSRAGVDTGLNSNVDASCPGLRSNGVSPRPPLRSVDNVVPDEDAIRDAMRR